MHCRFAPNQGRTTLCCCVRFHVSLVHVSACSFAVSQASDLALLVGYNTQVCYIRHFILHQQTWQTQFQMKLWSESRGILFPWTGWTSGEEISSSPRPLQLECIPLANSIPTMVQTASDCFTNRSLATCTLLVTTHALTSIVWPALFLREYRLHLL